MRTSNNTCTKQRNYSWLSPSWWTHITCKKHLSQHVFPKSHVEMDDLQTRVSQDTFLGRVTGGPQLWFPGLQISDTNSTVSPFPKIKTSQRQALLSVGLLVRLLKIILTFSSSLSGCVPGTVGLDELGAGVGRLTSEDHQVQQGIGAQSVGTVHWGATGLCQMEW